MGIPVTRYFLDHPPADSSLPESSSSQSSSSRDPSPPPSSSRACDRSPPASTSHIPDPTAHCLDSLEERVFECLIVFERRQEEIRAEAQGWHYEELRRFDNIESRIDDLVRVQ
ncbi:uncharacterized protein A4U43_C04F28240 [Asparagus officinalis]|uniref:Uncharacterized protein n=1 Tax=Asparagus officinalis TaxID=4686 RepID=A0A5P1F608_ASPOF|nr:uncharacterized protein A4U43_C04F28240 [Asparagus officinalis]